MELGIGIFSSECNGIHATALASCPWRSPFVKLRSHEVFDCVKLPLKGKRYWSWVGSFKFEFYSCAIGCNCMKIHIKYEVQMGVFMFQIFGIGEWCTQESCSRVGKWPLLPTHLLLLKMTFLINYLSTPIYLFSFSFFLGWHVHLTLYI